MNTMTKHTRRAAMLTRAAQPLDQNAAAVYLAQLGASSRRTMRVCLNQIAYALGAAQRPGVSASADDACLFVAWAALRFQHTAAIQAQIAARYRVHHANKILFALRGVLKSAWRLGQMSADDYTRAIDLKMIRGETLPRGRALARGEIGALLDACARDETYAGARDGALIALLRAGGLRRAEICALELADLDTETGALRVLGKGNKERSIPLPQGARDALADYCAVRGNETGALFYHITKAGALVCPLHRGGAPAQGEKLTPQAIYKMLEKRAAQAGVKNLSPHDFRRTFVSDLLDAGADIATVQKLAGHANVQTTARYDRRGEEAKRKAVELLHIPYKRRAFGARAQG